MHLCCLRTLRFSVAEGPEASLQDLRLCCVRTLGIAVASLLHRCCFFVASLLLLCCIAVAQQQLHHNVIICLDISDARVYDALAMASASTRTPSSNWASTLMESRAPKCGWTGGLFSTGDGGWRGVLLWACSLPKFRGGGQLAKSSMLRLPVILPLVCARMQIDTHKYLSNAHIYARIDAEECD